jgi:MinD-like ATPase involved in chromosome partitioning or flagellar assembly
MAPKIIAVLSGTRGSGKSTIALNLAMALMERGRKVLLVDASEEDHSIAKRLGVAPARFGFAYALNGLVPFKDVITRYRDTDLYLVLRESDIKPEFTYFNIARLLLNGIGLLSYDYIIADGPTPMLGKKFPAAFDVLLVSSADKAEIRKNLDEIRSALKRHDVHTDLVVNMAQEEMGDFKEALVTLPEEKGVAKSEEKHKPIYLMDKNSGFSNGIDLLASFYEERKFAKKKKGFLHF